MSTALVKSGSLLQPPLHGLPPVPWRDPHTVPVAALTAYIQQLEQACLDNLRSADLRTCLAMAYAVNYDVYKSMDALEAAIALDPENFWAQLKYGELHYRLRTLTRAEEETRKALNLARNGWQLSLARKQLQEVRQLTHTSVRNVTWNKPLAAPTIVLSLMLLAIFVVMSWR
jgi:tetratricopeptide (TPR) repeat protein